MDKMKIDLLTVAELSEMMNDITDDNDYISVRGQGGVTVTVTKGRATATALEALKRRDDRGGGKFFSRSHLKTRPA